MWLQFIMVLLFIIEHVEIYDPSLFASDKSKPAISRFDVEWTMVLAYPDEAVFLIISMLSCVLVFLLNLYKAGCHFTGIFVHSFWLSDPIICLWSFSFWTYCC